MKISIYFHLLITIIILAALREAGAVETRPGVGTFVAGKYRNLNELLYDLETRRLHLRPVPLLEEEYVD